MRSYGFSSVLSTTKWERAECGPKNTRRPLAIGVIRLLFPLSIASRVVSHGMAIMFIPCKCGKHVRYPLYEVRTRSKHRRALLLLHHCSTLRAEKVFIF